MCPENYPESSDALRLNQRRNSHAAIIIEAILLFSFRPTTTCCFLHDNVGFTTKHRITELMSGMDHHRQGEGSSSLQDG